MVDRDHLAGTASQRSQGEATLNVNYQDAGRMQLNARYTGTMEENGLVMSGSDSFVSRPVGFCIQSQSSAGECSASDASCHLYRYAGESFPLQLIAKAWDSATGEGGLVTPRLGMQNEPPAPRAYPKSVKKARPPHR